MKCALSLFVREQSLFAFINDVLYLAIRHILFFSNKSNGLSVNQPAVHYFTVTL
jgi:hypothetical protein